MKIAISVGDPNGVGLEILLKEHPWVQERCEPVYCCSYRLLEQACEKLKITLPTDMECADFGGNTTIRPGVVSPKSGLYSFGSFLKAVEMARTGDVQAVVTLPVHKEAWGRAGLSYRGHTEALRDIFRQPAIMLMGCPKLYIALFTEHVPLAEVSGRICESQLERFLNDLAREFPAEKIAVLGLNPHAGDSGLMGCEENAIANAVGSVNAQLGRELFVGPLVPDVAFTPAMRERHSVYVAMYHDQGLIPLKALYFEESINISLNLPIIRTSVDHGTAFDIAYRGETLNTLSYRNAISAAIELAERKQQP